MKRHHVGMAEQSHNPVTFFARTNFRDDRRVFGIKRADRRAHMYIIGKTGTGKSTLLETLIRHDMENGEGLALLDPHGDLVEKVLSQVPERRKEDTIYFNVPDSSHPLGLNPLETVAPQRRALAASGLLDVFKKVWADSWGPRLEHILRNAILALLDRPNSTLSDVLSLFHDKHFRRSTLFWSINEHVRNFWLNEYEGYPARLRSEAIAPIQNKVGAFLSNPVLRNIITQEKSAFKLRRIMDAGQILLVNLSKGKIGEDTANLLGSLLVSRIGLAALSRTDIPEEDRRDFYVYLDEFQNFTTLSLATMLPELRKYRCNLILAHQHFTQIEEQLRDTILGNAGTIISFRVGPADAEFLEKEFYPEATMIDLVNVPNYQIYLKLMVDGKISTPFSGETLDPTICPLI